VTSTTSGETDQGVTVIDVRDIYISLGFKSGDINTLNNFSHGVPNS
jgi:hypothetical protein